MKIFVQSASVAEIREWASAGLLDGVVLSPVDLAAEDPSATVLERLAEIDRRFRRSGMRSCQCDKWRGHLPGSA